MEAQRGKAEFYRLESARKSLHRAEMAKTRKNLHNSGVLDYIIVEGNDLDTFTADIMKKMAEGYILQGGISYIEQSEYSHKKSYRQALVKSNGYVNNRLRSGGGGGGGSGGGGGGGGGVGGGDGEGSESASGGMRRNKRTRKQVKRKKGRKI